MSIASIMATKHIAKELLKDMPVEKKSPEDVILGVGLIVGSMVVAGAIGSAISGSYDTGIKCSMLGPIVAPIVGIGGFLIKEKFEDIKEDIQEYFHKKNVINNIDEIRSKSISENKNNTQSLKI